MIALICSKLDDIRCLVDRQSPLNGDLIHLPPRNFNMSDCLGIESYKEKAPNATSLVNPLLLGKRQRKSFSKI